MRKGIDISHHNGDIDFNKVKNSGIGFVIIREGYGTRTDRMFFENVKKAKEVGLDILAIYHFSYALNKEQSKIEAKVCVENIKKADLGKDVLVFYDFEYDTVTEAARSGIILNRNDCNNFTSTFCEEIKLLGFTPGIYTNMDYYKNWYSEWLLSGYVIWLADYAGDPDVNCLFHQYSNKGIIPGIIGHVDLDYDYSEKNQNGEKDMRSRSEVVKLASSWIGKKESDGSYKEIIDIYNSISGEFPRGIKMQYGWSWCACMWSAIAIRLGYMDIMPIEISCGELIKKAKEMGCWKENDDYIPSPADGILYDWGDNGIGDNVDWPDHIGIIEYVNKESGYMTIIEGNYDNAVKKRTVSINGRYIRGFITPKYDDNFVIYETLGTSTDIEIIAREVIAGVWGNFPKRKDALERNGWNYEDVRKKVNEILNEGSKIQTSMIPQIKKIETSCYAKSEDNSLAGEYMTITNLYCRNDAGTNKKALCLIPKGTKVRNFGFYTEFGGIKWLLIQCIVNGILYTGFSSSKYLIKR